MSGEVLSEEERGQIVRYFLEGSAGDRMAEIVERIVAAHTAAAVAEARAEAVAPFAALADQLERDPMPHIPEGADFAKDVMVLQRRNFARGLRALLPTDTEEESR